MLPKYAGLLAGILGSAAVVSPAVADDWTIARITGQAWIVSQSSPAVPASAGATVAAGSTIATGPTGRAMLVHGLDTMMLGPGTKIAVPYKPDSGMTATVFQQTGSVDLSVEHLSTPHFSVQTPYLAAVVKGTVFKVTVTDGAANVAVQRGVVGVADLKTGERSDVAAGQSAGVSSSGGLHVAGLKNAPAVQRGKPQKSVVSLTRSAAAKASAATASNNAVGTQATEVDDSVFSQASNASPAAEAGQTSGGDKNSAIERNLVVASNSNDDPADPEPPVTDPVDDGPGTPVTDTPPVVTPVVDPPVTTPLPPPPPVPTHHTGFWGWLENHPGWLERHHDWVERHPRWLQHFLDAHPDVQLGAAQEKAKGKGKTGGGKANGSAGKGDGKSGKGTGGKGNGKSRY